MADQKNSAHWLDKMSGIIANETEKETERCKTVANAFVKEVINEFDNEKSETSRSIRYRTNKGKNHMNLVWEGDGDGLMRIWKWKGTNDRECLNKFEKEIHATLNEKYNKHGFRFQDRGGWFRGGSKFQIYCKWDKV